MNDWLTHNLKSRDASASKNTGHSDITFGIVDPFLDYEEDNFILVLVDCLTSEVYCERVGNLTSGLPKYIIHLY